MDNPFSIQAPFAVISSATRRRSAGSEDADEQTLRRGTVHKFHRTIVVKAKPSRRISNVDRHALWRSGYLKQKLMLLRVQADLLRRSFAELKKGPQLVSKLREHLQQLSFFSHRAHS